MNGYLHSTSERRQFDNFRMSSAAPSSHFCTSYSSPPPFHLHSIRNALRYFLIGAILKPCTLGHSAAEPKSALKEAV
jgi:hypothetical protein